MKKTIILFAGLLFAFTSVAGTGCARWWYKHYDAEWIVKKIDKRIEKLDLNLTEEQKVKLNALKGKIVEHVNSRRNTWEKMMKLFKEESDKDTPSFDGLVASFKENHAKRSRGIDEIADLLNDFYLSLDSVQKKKVVEALRSKVNKCERWFN